MSDIGVLAESIREDAKASGLRYLGDEKPGISRRASGDGFSYVSADGQAIHDDATLARIKSLAIPPAWIDVWISPAANGHLQATGRDARGRKQYRYHADFRAARDQTKYEHIFAFGAALEKVRRRLDADMARRGLPREKVVATVVHLLDTTMIRVGNSEYARDNGSFGLTTLRRRHVDVTGDALRFEFKGKSGKSWQLSIRDRRVARIVRSCQELPGQDLFQYLDESGERQSVGSADVNAYLREVTGADITAKDFRTFAGTVLAATALLQFKPFEAETEAKVNVRAAIKEVAARLGNTPTVCRKCYIHPEVLAGYLDGTLLPHLAKVAAPRKRVGLSGEERAVLRFLRARLVPQHAGKKRTIVARRPQTAPQLAASAA